MSLCLAPPLPRSSGRLLCGDWGPVPNLQIPTRELNPWPSCHHVTSLSQLFKFRCWVVFQRVTSAPVQRELFFSGTCARCCTQTWNELPTDIPPRQPFVPAVVVLTEAAGSLAAYTWERRRIFFKSRCHNYFVATSPADTGAASAWMNVRAVECTWNNMRTHCAQHKRAEGRKPQFPFLFSGLQREPPPPPPPCWNFKNNLFPFYMWNNSLLSEVFQLYVVLFELGHELHGDTFGPSQNLECFSSVWGQKTSETEPWWTSLAFIYWLLNFFFKSPD